VVKKFSLRIGQIYYIVVVSIYEENMMVRGKALANKYLYSKDKKFLLARMKKIEGQAKGIQRMLQDDRYCVDIVQQLTALSSAADKVALIILQNHIEGCITDAIRQHEGEAYIKELMVVLRKAMRQ